MSNQNSMYTYMDSCMSDLSAQYNKVYTKVEKLGDFICEQGFFSPVENLCNTLYPGTWYNQYSLSRDTIIVLGFLICEMNPEVNDIVSSVNACLEQNNRDKLYARDIHDAIIIYFLSFRKPFDNYVQFMNSFMAKNKGLLQAYLFANSITDVNDRKNEKNKLVLNKRDLDEIIECASKNYSKRVEQGTCTYTSYIGTYTRLLNNDLSGKYTGMDFSEEEISEIVLSNLESFSDFGIKRHYWFLKLLKRYFDTTLINDDNTKLRLSSYELDELVNRDTEEGSGIHGIAEELLAINSKILQPDRLGLFAKFGEREIIDKNDYVFDFDMITESLVSDTYRNIQEIRKSQDEKYTRNSQRRIEIAQLLIDKPLLIDTLEANPELYNEISDVSTSTDKSKYIAKIIAQLHQPRVIKPLLKFYLNSLENFSILDANGKYILDDNEIYALWELLKSQKDNRCYEDIDKSEITEYIMKVYKEKQYFQGNSRLVEKIVKGERKVEKEHLINMYKAGSKKFSESELKRILLYCGFSYGG